jgi:hypothetical protein
MRAKKRELECSMNYREGNRKKNEWRGALELR